MIGEEMTEEEKDEGEILKNIGMNQSSSNAESKHPGWMQEALGYVRDYPGKRFLVESVRRFAERQGLPIPPSKRAWGSVITKAKRLGYVKAIGFRTVSNPKAHRTPATYWEKIEENT